VAAIRMMGMASGLPPNLVEQIMDAERIPLKNMEKDKTKEDDKLKLVSDFETKVRDIQKNLDDLVGTRGFSNNKLISGDASIIDGSVESDKAITGQWQVEVMQLAQKPGAVSNGFPDKDKTQIGVGYFKFKTPNGVKEVYVNGKQNTLEGVANAINSSGIGMRATVLNDRKDKAAPFKLLVTGLATGDDMQVEFPVVYLLDGDSDFYFDNSKKAQNAIVKIDGFEMEIPDNVTTDVIPGVTLDLKQAAPGREVRVAVKEDTEAIGGKIKSFVEAYNKALQFVQDQSKLQKGPDGKERLGPLGGDSLIRGAESALRRVVLTPQYGVDSDIKLLNQLGVEFNRNGTLNYNPEKFDAALKGRAQSVAKFFRGDGVSTGLIASVKREVSNLTNSTTGPISNRKKAIQQKINQIDQRVERKEKQLEKKEESLRRKFAELETTMSKLQSQGSALAGGLGQKPQG
jgi:flagellar hook-associated protein 2